MPLFRHPAQRVVASSLLVQLTIVVTGPLAVRLLGVEGRGEVAIVLAAALLVGQVVPWGLPQAFSYTIASGESDARTLIREHGARYARHSVVAGLIGALLVALLVVARPVGDPAAQVGLGFVGAVVTMVAVLVVSSLQGAGRFTALAVIQLVPGIFYAVGLLALMILDHDSVLTVLALYFSGWVVTGFIGLVVLLRERAVEAVAPPLDQLRRFGRRVMIAASAPIDNLGVDQLTVGLLLGAHGLGTYVVALAFKTPLALVLTSIAGVCATQVAGISDAGQARRYCRRWILIAIAAGALVAAVLEVAIDLILVPAFGEEAEAARAAAHWLVLAGIPLGLRRVVAGLLQGLGEPGAASRAEMIGLAVMLVGMVALTPALDVVGAVVASGLGATVAVVGSGLSLRNALRRRATELAPHV